MDKHNAVADRIVEDIRAQVRSLDYDLVDYGDKMLDDLAWIIASALRRTAADTWQAAAEEALLKRDVFFTVSSVPTMERDLLIRQKMRDEIYIALIAKANALRAVEGQASV